MKTDIILVTEVFIIVFKCRITTGNCYSFNNCIIELKFYIHLSKAFDSLRHDILLDKLTHYGITGTATIYEKLFMQSQTVCSDRGHRI